MDKKIIVSIGFGTTVSVIMYFSFFMTPSTYEIFSSSERILDFENSTKLSELRNIHEVDLLVQKHQNTHRVIFLVQDPISTEIITSGGYTGENLRIFHLSLGMYLKCWTDHPGGKIFYSDIAHHIENNSCKEYW